MDDERLQRAIDEVAALFLRYGYSRRDTIEIMIRVLSVYSPPYREAAPASSTIGLVDGDNNSGGR